MKLMRTGNLVRCTVVAIAAVAAASCGDVVNSSQSPAMLVVTSIRPTGVVSTTLESDVANESSPCSTANPCVIHDLVRASLSVVMKNVTLDPTTNNDVIITGYHVSYRRSDGRNTPGTDVPFPWDGAVAARVEAGSTANVDFEIVRAAAKLESPLVDLRRNVQVISTIADVTFHAVDQVGNDLTGTGSVLITFANFADSN